MRPNLSVFLDKFSSLAPVVALSSSLPIVFAAHSMFSFGVWRRAEPVIVAFHASSALCSIALLLVWWRDRSALNGVITHPFVLLPAALALWSAFTAPLADFPLLSLLGSPQTGEGALWYGNLALLIACALIVVREKAQWRFLIIWSVVIVSGVIAIKLMASARGTYELFWIGAYLAYISIALPFICLRHLEGYWRWLWLVILGASVSILIMAKSKAAIILFSFGVAFVGLGYLFKSVSRIGRYLRFRPVAITIVGLIAVLPLFVISLGTFNEIPSLRSRFLVSKVMGEAQGTDWLSIIIGQGWGRTQDALVANLHVSGEQLWSSHWFWSKHWDYLWGDYSHTHNWIVESMYSVGIPGFLLSLMFLLAIPYCSDGKQRTFATAMSAVYAGMNSLWFQVSFSLPFVALALAALGGDWKIQREYSKKVSNVCRVVPIFLTVCLLAQIAAASALFTFGIKTSEVIATYQNPKINIEKIHFPPDFRGAEHGFALAIRDHLAWLRKSSSTHSKLMVKHQEKVVRSIIKDLKGRIRIAKSPYIVLAGVAVFSDLVYDPKLKWLQFKLRSNELALWGHWVKKLLELAPGRTDTTIPYFSRLIFQGDVTTLINITQTILEKTPNDPVGLYFRGAAMIRAQQKDTQVKGLQYLKKGLEKGIERFMPVDPKLKKRILELK